MLDNTFRGKPYTFKRPGARLPTIDPAALQEVRGKSGVRTLTFTFPGTQAQPSVDPIEFDQGETKVMEAILVRIILPKGMYRTRSLLGQQPDYGTAGPDNGGRELFNIPNTPIGPRTFQLAAQVAEVRAVNKQAEEAVNILEKYPSDTILIPFRCEKTKAFGPHGKPCMQAIKIGLSAAARSSASDAPQDFISCVFDHRPHYGERLTDHLRKLGWHGEIEYPLHLVPCLFRSDEEQEPPHYELVWQAFQDKSAREEGDRILRTAKNDFTFDWEKGKKPIRDIGIRLSDCPTLSMCQIEDDEETGQEDPFQ